MAPDHLAGRRYVERGQLVTVLIGFCARRAPQITGDWLHFRWPDGKRPATGPRNVAIRRADGTTVVRAFRGLRRIR